jgi:hypothetical protein
MATHRRSILNRLQWDDSGNGYTARFDDLATNDVWKQQVLVFKDTATRILLYGQFEVPQNYVGTAKLVLKWSASATTNNVVWDFDYRTVGGNDTTSLDQTGTEEAVTVTDAAPGAAWRILETSINLTSANFTAGEEVEFLIGRDGADGADTMAASAVLIGAYFEYADA